MVFVTSASHYLMPASRHHPRYQSKSSMYIRGLIPRNFAELAEAVPIAYLPYSLFQIPVLLVTSGGLGTTVCNMDKFLQDSGSGNRIISNPHADAFLLIFANFFSLQN